MFLQKYWYIAEFEFIKYQKELKISWTFVGYHVALLPGNPPVVILVDVTANYMVQQPPVWSALAGHVF